MSETDKVAIQMVKDLQTNIRNTTIAMVGILIVALFAAIFWGGGINNQVDTNKENIKELTRTVSEYIKEQQAEREAYVKKSEMIPFQQAWNEMATNWGHISYWAESRGYTPLTRSQKDGINKTKVD